MRRSSRCQGGKNSCLVSSVLQKSWDLGENTSDLVPLGVRLLKTLNLLVSYSLLILGDALGAALPLLGKLFPHLLGRQSIKTKY